MEAVEQMWAIKDMNGKMPAIVRGTVQHEKMGAIHTFLETKREKWEYWTGCGYRCVRVEVREIGVQS